MAKKILSVASSALYNLGSSISDFSLNVYNATVSTLYWTETPIRKTLERCSYKLIPIYLKLSDVISAKITLIEYYLYFILKISKNAEHLDELLTANIRYGFDINKHKIQYIRTDSEGTKTPFKVSPIIYLLHDKERDAVDKIKILIKHGIDVNYRDSNTLNDINILSLLLTNKYSAEEVNELITALIKHGFDINRYKHPLMHTSTQGQITHFKGSPIAQLLLDKTKEAIDKIKILVKHGIDITYQSPLDPNITNIILPLLLKNYSAKDIGDLMPTLIEHGFDINGCTVFFKDESFYIEPPLIGLLESDESDDLTKIKILIQHGIDVLFKAQHLELGDWNKTPYEMMIFHKDKTELLDCIHDAIVNGIIEFDETKAWPKENEDEEDEVWTVEGEAQERQAAHDLTLFAIAIRKFKLSKHTQADKEELYDHLPFELFQTKHLNKEQTLLKKHLSIHDYFPKLDLGTSEHIPPYLSNIVNKYLSLSDLQNSLDSNYSEGIKLIGDDPCYLFPSAEEIYG